MSECPFIGIRSTAGHAARLVRQEWLDGGPFVIGEFVAHHSKLRFGSLNQPGDAINHQRRIAADAHDGLVMVVARGAGPHRKCGRRRRDGPFAGLSRGNWANRFKYNGTLERYAGDGVHHRL